MPTSDTPPSPAGIPAPSTASPSATGLAPNIAAGLACLFSIVGGVVFLFLEKKDKFVRYWAMQSAFLGGLAIAVSIFVRVAHFIFDLIPWIGKVLIFITGAANLAFGLASLVVYIISVVKAFSGQEWEIPWLGPIARKKLEQMDGAPEQAAT
jgi:uncharacterized membrane protein